MSERDLENFLSRHQLCIPESDQSFIPVLLSDSKGNRLKISPDCADIPIEFLCQSGATTRECFTLLQDRLPDIIKKHQKPAFVYIWTGTCDITRKGKKGQIEVRSPDSDDLVERVASTFQEIVRFVLQKGGRVKFIGVPTYSVTRYNQYKSGKTLSFQSQDAEVSRQVSILNQQICQINEQLGVSTLKFNADLVKSHKKKNTINFNLLADGLHPSVLLSRKWLRKLQIDICRTCYTSNTDCISVDPQELLEFNIKENHGQN